MATGFFAFQSITGTSASFVEVLYIEVILSAAVRCARVCVCEEDALCEAALTPAQTRTETIRVIGPVMVNHTPFRSTLL